MSWFTVYKAHMPNTNFAIDNQVQVTTKIAYRYFWDLKTFKKRA